MYGMGEASIAFSLKCSIEEARNIKQGFFKEFPKVEKWITKTEADAKVLGYVEDVWGRRRRLPDLLKEKYEINIITIEDIYMQEEDEYYVYFYFLCNKGAKGRKVLQFWGKCGIINAIEI